MNENSAIAIIVVSALVTLAVIVSVAITSDNNAKEMLACYEAAKVNTNINCNKYGRAEQ